MLPPVGIELRPLIASDFSHSRDENANIGISVRM